jgi:hypothetical protein
MDIGTSGGLAAVDGWKLAPLETGILVAAQEPTAAAGAPKRWEVVCEGQ